MRGYMYVCVGVWASFPMLGKRSYLLSENPAGWQVLTTGYTMKVVPIRSKKRVLSLWCFPFQAFKLSTSFSPNSKILRCLSCIEKLIYQRFCF